MLHPKMKKLPVVCLLTRTSAFLAIVICATLFTNKITYAASQNSGNILLEEIITTATKKAGGISVQDAPLALTAFDEAQIDALHMRTVQSLAFSVPNVQLEEVGTTRGTANFSIRGLGINSSIPSIDPTVGVFVDGMYYGLNAGVVMDTFDLAGVEVLRGPQGILFGRNVTGGAVLLRTTLPGDEFHMNNKFSVESGLNYTASTVMSGPITDKLGAKLAVYYNDDRGYFKNLADGNDHFGDADTRLLRGALTYAVNDSLDVILRYEHGVSKGDGPAAKNLGLFARENFDFAIDEDGFYENRWNNAILETTLDVGFGDGQIVNILAYRDYNSETLGDIDATPSFLFHAPGKTDQDQWSNELRYSGTFGRTVATTGVYYFTQEMDYLERRIILGGRLDLTGGGIMEAETWGVFSQFDISLTEQWILTVGGRYTTEDKEARVATIPLNRCNLDSGHCSLYDFNDSDDWDSFMPKVGLQWIPDDTSLYYLTWTKGFRSGGYNLRNTSPTASPGPFDQEEQDSYEIGMKKDFLDGRLRVNAAAFYNEIDDLQREVVTPDPIVGVVQVVKNTAAVTLSGFELELTAVITERLTTQVFAGYTDGEYDKVLFDLSGDTIVDDTDLALDLPRLSPWEYGAALIYDYSLGEFGMLTGRASFSHRDGAAFSENNIGQLTESDMVDMSLAWAINDKLSVSLYGKNLKDEATIGGSAELPFFPGATFSPLNKGRIFGAEIQYRY